MLKLISDEYGNASLFDDDEHQTIWKDTHDSLLQGIVDRLDKYVNEWVSTPAGQEFSSQVAAKRFHPMLS
jgi:hypothetical protein